MEMILEQTEIVYLVREALSAKGVDTKHLDAVSVRHNHKHGTIRLVLSNKES
jgi:hypothetical protein